MDVYDNATLCTPLFFHSWTVCAPAATRRAVQTEQCIVAIYPFAVHYQSTDISFALNTNIPLRWKVEWNFAAFIIWVLDDKFLVSRFISYTISARFSCPDNLLSARWSRQILIISWSRLRPTPLRSLVLFGRWCAYFEKNKSRKKGFVRRTIAMSMTSLQGNSSWVSFFALILTFSYGMAGSSFASSKDRVSAVFNNNVQLFFIFANNWSLC